MINMISDIGNKRSLNEDYAGYLEKENYKIYVVADGMGGHNAGEVASKMAVEAIVSYISENINNKNYNEILKKAIKTANNAIYDFASTSEKLNGMGTTVTACLVINNKGFVANVGDSSCFLIRNNKIKKITKDHSLVQELLDLGTISEEEAFNHPKKNIITRAVGTSKKILIDVFEIDILKDDIIMLCSDGLTNEIQKNEVLEILNSAKSLKNACEKLVLEAKNNGGRDNITVLLFGGDE